jgi:hypothetical protein
MTRRDIRRAVPPGYHLIFVRSFRHAKTGKIIRAEQHGRQAFALVVRKRPTD